MPGCSGRYSPPVHTPALPQHRALHNRARITPVASQAHPRPPKAAAAAATARQQWSPRPSQHLEGGGPPEGLLCHHHQHARRQPPDHEVPAAVGVVKVVQPAESRSVGGDRCLIDCVSSRPQRGPTGMGWGTAAKPPGGAHTPPWCPATQAHHKPFKPCRMARLRPMP